MKNLSRGLLSLVAVLAVVALPGAAHAERVVHRDARADVTMLVTHPETEEETEEPAPTVKAGDVLKTVVDHRSRKVVVKVRYANLRRGDEFAGHFLRVVTNERLRRNIVLMVSVETPRGDVTISKGNGRVTSCKGLTHRISYSRETLRIEIPRRCLSNPRWVRVGFGSFRFPTLDGDETYLDDANREHRFGETAPALGVRVQRN